MAAKRFAVVGVGNWGSMHAKVYSRHPGAELALVCDADAARARECAARYGAAATPDWRDVAGDPGIDAVSVATPDFAHAEVALGMIEAGKDVLVEKPLATTVEECEQIARAAERRGVRLMVDFHNRWSPAFWQARQAVQNGTLGEISLIYMRLNDTIFVPTRMLSWAAKSSPLWFLGSHCVDTLCWMLNDEVESVSAVEGRRILSGIGIDTPDFVLSTLRFRRGAVATVENAWISPETAPSVFELQAEVLGSHGSLRIDTSHNRTVELYTPEKAAYLDVLAAPEVHGRQMGFAAESIRHFADCVVEGRQPSVTAADGLANTRVLCAIEKAIAEPGSVVPC